MNTDPVLFCETKTSIIDVTAATVSPSLGACEAEGTGFLRAPPPPPDQQRWLGSEPR